jgi:SAM-dependent methyltransferase
LTAVPEPADTDYRRTHQDAGHASRYDDSFLTPGSAHALNWSAEQRLLDLVFARHLGRPQRAVDFACGTGRILGYLEQRVPDALGVDVSPAMLELARDRCRSPVVCHDVTVDTLELPPVDLVTAFRFFLNAQPELRQQALRWIAGVLAPGGALVANAHLNPASLRGRYLRLRWGGGAPRSPMLSVAAFDAVLAEAGFRVEARYGYDFLPYRRDGARLRLVRLRERVEFALLDRARLAGWGGAFLVVARRAA